MRVPNHQFWQYRRLYSGPSSKRNNQVGKESSGNMTFFKGLPPAWGLLITLTICYLLSILSFVSGDIAVPSYVYPCFDQSNTCAWYVFKEGATIVVINPNSGPGTAPIQEFVQLCDTVQTDSTVETVLGYVSTSYGNKPASAVLSDIDTYYAYYDIDGIFLDEGSTSCSNAIVAQYKSYDDRVKTHWGSDGYTSLNWGTQGSECYLTGTDIDLYINFEGSYNTYVNSYIPNPSWVSNYSAYFFWHIVYGTPVSASSVQAGVSLAQGRGAGYYYFTDNSEPNPYNTSPAQTIWNAEVNA